MSTLRERIDILRGSKTVEEFCELVGVSRGTVYDAFRREREEGIGKHNMRRDTAERLVAGSKYSVAWINGDEESGEVLKVSDQPPKVYVSASGRDLEAAKMWLALVELVEADGIDLKKAYETLNSGDFDRREGDPTSFDVYQLAKRRLREDGKR